MTPQTVSEQLKAIGPHVTYASYQENGVLLHMWEVRETEQHSRSSKIANLCMVSDIHALSDDEIEQGRAKYESSVPRR